MEQQKLPNSTLILVFGIVSIVTCCCYGIIGLIFGIIAIVLAKKATVVYLENPEQYTGYSNVKTGKILAIIGDLVICYTRHEWRDEYATRSNGSIRFIRSIL